MSQRNNRPTSRRTNYNKQHINQDPEEKNQSKIREARSVGNKINPGVYQGLEDQILGKRSPRARVQYQNQHQWTQFQNQSQPDHGQLKVKPNRRDVDQQSNISSNIPNIKNQQEFERQLKLSQLARQALQKIQRFDRFIYAKEAQKNSKQALQEQLKRIQKIKNSNKIMRTKLFDNQLTVTALYNMIKLLNQMGEETRNYKIKVEEIQNEQKKKKQQKFEADLQAKRNRGAIKKQQQIKKLIDTIQEDLINNNTISLKKNIQIFIKRFSSQESSKKYLPLYQLINKLLNQNQVHQQQNQYLSWLINFMVDINSENQQNYMKSLKDKSKQIQVLKRRHFDKTQDNSYIDRLEQFFKKVSTKNQLQLKESNLPKKQSHIPTRSNLKKQKQQQSINNDMKSKIQKLSQKMKQLENKLQSYQKLNDKIIQINNKVNQNKQYGYELMSLNNSPQLKHLELSNVLYALLSTFKTKSAESGQLDHFLTAFIEIINNSRFNSNRKKVQMQRLLKRLNIKDKSIFEGFQNAILKSTEVTPSPSQYDKSQTPKSQISSQNTEQIRSMRKFKRSQSPDIVDDVIQMNSKFTKKNIPIPRKYEEERSTLPVKVHMQQKQYDEQKLEKLTNLIKNKQQQLAEANNIIDQLRATQLTENPKQKQIQLIKREKQLEKQKKLLTGKQQKFQRDKKKLQYQQEQFKQLKQHLKQFQVFQKTFSLIIQKIESNPTREIIDKQIQILRRDKTKSNNQLTKQFLKYEEYSSQINKTIMNEQIHKISELLQNLRQIYNNDSFNSARLKKQVDRLIDITSKKNINIGEIKDNLLGLVQAVTKRAIQQQNKIIDQNKSKIDNEQNSKNQHEIKKLSDEIIRNQQQVSSLTDKIKQYSSKNQQLQGQNQKFRKNISQLQRKHEKPIVRTEGTQTDPDNNSHDKIISALQNQIAQKSKQLQQKQHKDENNKEQMQKIMQQFPQIPSVIQQEESDNIDSSQRLSYRKISIQISKIITLNKSNPSSSDLKLLDFILKLIEYFQNIQNKLHSSINKLNHRLSAQQKNYGNNQQIQELKNQNRNMKLELEQERYRNEQLYQNNTQLTQKNMHLQTYEEQLSSIGDIVKRIQQGGQWWKKVPRRIKRNQKISPVYQLIDICKSKDQTEKNNRQSISNKSELSLGQQIDGYMQRLQQLQNRQIKQESDLLGEDSKNDQNKWKPSEEPKSNQFTLNDNILSASSNNNQQDTTNKLAELLKQKQTQLNKLIDQFQQLKKQKDQQIQALEQELFKQKQENIDIGEHEAVIEGFQNAQSMLDRMKTDIEDLRKINQKLNDENQQKQTLNNKLNQQNVQLEQIQQNLRQTNKKLMKQIQQISISNSSQLQEQINKIQQAKKILLEQNQSLSEQIQKLLATVKYIQQKYADIEKQLQQLADNKNNQIQNLNILLLASPKKQSNGEVSKQQLESKQRLLEQAKKQLKDLSYRFQQLFQQLESIKINKDAEISQLNNNFNIATEQYQVQIQGLKKLHDEKESQNNQQKYINQIRQWENRYQILQKNYHELQEKKREKVVVTKPMDSSPFWQQKYGELNLKYKTLQTQHKQLRNNYQYSQKQISKLKTDNDTVIHLNYQQHQKYNQQIERRDIELNQMEDRIILLSDRICELEIQIEKINQSSRLNEDNSREIHNRGDESQLNNINDESSQNIGVKQIQLLTNQIAQLQYQINEQTETINHLNKKPENDKENDEDEQNNRDKLWQERYNAISLQFHNYKAANRDGNITTKKQIEDIKLQARVLKQQNTQLMGKIKNKTSQIINFKNQVKLLKQTIQELQDMKNRYENDSVEIQGLNNVLGEGEGDSHEGQLSEIQKKLKRTESQLRKKSQQNIQLKQQIIATQSKMQQLTHHQHHQHHQHTSNTNNNNNTNKQHYEIQLLKQQIDDLTHELSRIRGLHDAVQNENHSISVVQKLNKKLIELNKHIGDNLDTIGHGGEQIQKQNNILKEKIRQLIIIIDAFKKQQGWDLIEQKWLSQKQQLQKIILQLQSELIQLNKNVQYIHQKQEQIQTQRQRQIHGQQHNKQQLNTQNIQLKQLNNQLQQQNNILQQKDNYLQQQINILKQQIILLKQQIILLKQQNQQQNNNNNNNNTNQYQQQNTNLKKQSQQINHKYKQQLLKQLQQKQQIQTTNQAELSSIKQIHQKQLQNKNSQIYTLTMRLQHIQQQLSVQKQQNQQLVYQIKQYNNNNNNQYQHNNIHRSDSLDSLLIYRQQNQLLQAKVQQLQQQIAVLSDPNQMNQRQSNMQQQMRLLILKMSILQKQITQKQGISSVNYKQQQQHQSNKITTVQRQLDQLKQKLKQQYQSKYQINADLLDHKSQQKDLKQKYDLINQQRNYLNTDNQQLRDQLSRLQNKLEIQQNTNKEQINKLKQQCERITGDYQRSNKKYQKAKAKDQCEQLKEKLVELTYSLEQIQRSQFQNRSEKQRKGSQDHDKYLFQIKEQLALAVKTNQLLQTQRNITHQQLQELIKTNHNLTSANDNYNIQINTLKSQIKMLNKQTEHLHDLKQRQNMLFNRLKLQKDQYKQSSQAMYENIQQMQAQIQERNKQIRNLQRQLQDSKKYQKEHKKLSSSNVEVSTNKIYTQQQKPQRLKSEHNQRQEPSSLDIEEVITSQELKMPELQNADEKIKNLVHKMYNMIKSLRFVVEDQKQTLERNQKYKNIFIMNLTKQFEALLQQLMTTSNKQQSNNMNKLMTTEYDQNSNHQFDNDNNVQITSGKQALQKKMVQILIKNQKLQEDIAKVIQAANKQQNQAQNNYNNFEITKYTQQISRLQSFIQTLKHSQQKLSNQQNQDRQEIQRLIKVIGTLQQQQIYLREKQSNLFFKIRQLQMEAEGYKRIIRQKLQGENHKQRQSDSEIQSLKDLLNRYKQQIQQKQDIIGQLQQVLQKHLSDNQSLSNRIKQQQKYYQKQINQMGNTNNQHQYQKKNIMAEIDKLNHVNQNLLREINDLNNNVTKSSNLVSQEKQVTYQIEKQQKELYIQQLEENIANLDKQNVELMKNIHILRESMINIQHTTIGSQNIQKNSLNRNVNAQRTKSGSDPEDLEQSVADSYDEAELEILRRINLQVADLVEANRRLQMKVALLQQNHPSSNSQTEYFLLLQQKMEKLMNWLVNKTYIRNGHSLANFSAQTNVYLHQGNYLGYMDKWLEFIKDLFRLVYESQQQQLYEKAQELNKLRSSNFNNNPQNQRKPLPHYVDQKGTQGTTNTQIAHSNGSQPVNISTNNHIQIQLDSQNRQAEIILGDTQYLLREYLKTSDPEYLRLMANSLGLQKSRPESKSRYYSFSGQYQQEFMKKS